MTPRYKLRLSYYPFDDGVEARFSKVEDGRQTDIADVSLVGVGKDFGRAVKVLREQLSEMRVVNR